MFSQALLVQGSVRASRVEQTAVTTGAAGTAVAGGYARGIATMALAMFLLACMDAISRHLAQQFPVPQILAVRFTVFCLFALALVRPRSLREAFRTRYPILQIARSLIIAVEVGVFVLAFRYLPLAEVHAIAGVAPLLVTALAVMFLGETVGPRRWMAVGFGFVGLLIIVRPGSGVMSWTALIPLGGAVLWAIYQILVRKVKDDPAGTSLLYMASIGALIMLVIAPFYWQTPDASGWFWMLALGVVGSIGHLVLIHAFQAAPASVLQPFHYTVLLWATLMGYLVFGELPDLWTIAGGLAIAGSGIYVFYRENRQRQE